MTDIPAYNEKEISMKDISFSYKSDRRGSNPRSRPRARVTNYATIAFVMFVSSLVSSTCYIIHDRGASVNSYFGKF